MRIRSRLTTDRASLWAHASSMAGVNAELAPMHMSHPDGAAIGPDVPLGVPLFRSLVTLWGVVPLDLHEFALVEIRPGEGFHESSRSLLERRWIHRRTLADVPGGIELTDELEFEPRLAGFLVARVIAHTFTRRHARLRRLFAGRETEPPRVEWRA